MGRGREVLGCSVRKVLEDMGEDQIDRTECEVAGNV